MALSAWSPARQDTTGHPPSESDLPALARPDRVPRYRRRTIYGEAAVNVSRDSGKTFDRRVAPGVMLDVEADPGDFNRLIASTQRGIVVSADEGRSSRDVEPIPNVRFP